MTVHNVWSMRKWLAGYARRMVGGNAPIGQSWHSASVHQKWHRQTDPWENGATDGNTMHRMPGNITLGKICAEYWEAKVLGSTQLPLERPDYFHVGVLIHLYG